MWNGRALETRDHCQDAIAVDRRRDSRQVYADWSYPMREWVAQVGQKGLLNWFLASGLSNWVDDV